MDATATASVYTVELVSHDDHSRGGWHILTIHATDRLEHAIELLRAYMPVGPRDDGESVVELTDRHVWQDARGVHEQYVGIVEWCGGERVKCHHCGDGWVSEYVPLSMFPDGVTRRALLLPDPEAL